MAAIRKRRTLHNKSSRQQQLQQQQQLRAKQRFESSRLKPEQSTTMIHDESDTVSFRSYLLMNFVKSAEYMDVLMTQAIPNDKIRPPAVYPSSFDLEAMKERLRVQKEQLRSAKEAFENFSWGFDRESQFLKEGLAKTENEPEESSSVLQEYLKQFELRSQVGTVVFHKDKFNYLRADKREAPAEYWHQYSQRLEQERNDALMEKKRQEEEGKERQRLLELEKSKREAEEDRRRQELERRKQLEELQKNAISQGGTSAGHLAFPDSDQGQLLNGQPTAAAQYAIPGQNTADQNPLSLQSGSQQFFDHQDSQSNQAGEHQLHPPMGQIQDVAQEEPRQQIPQQQLEQHQQLQHQHQQQQHQHQLQHQHQPPSEAVENIFGGFDDEPFNNGFEDDFGDLDTAFF